MVTLAHQRCSHFWHLPSQRLDQHKLGTRANAAHLKSQFSSFHGLLHSLTFIRKEATASLIASVSIFSFFPFLFSLASNLAISTLLSHKVYICSLVALGCLVAITDHVPRTVPHTFYWFTGTFTGTGNFTGTFTFTYTGTFTGTCMQTHQLI